MDISLEKTGKAWGDLLGIPGEKQEYETPAPDPIYNEAKQRQFDQAMGDGPNLEQKYGENIDRAKGFITSTPQQGLWSQAIQEKANQRFDSYTDKLKRRAQYDSRMDKNTMLNAALNATQAQRTLERHVEMQKASADANFQAERNRAISSILNTTGTLVGGIYGGAGGAKAGSQSGSMLMGGSQQDTSSYPVRGNSTGSSYNSGGGYV